MILRHVIRERMTTRDMPWVESLKSKPTVCARRSQPNLPRGSQMVVLRTLVEIHIEWSRLFNLYQSSHVRPPRCQGWSNSSCTSAPCNVQRPGRFQFWSLTRQAPRSAPRGRDSSGTGGPNEFCSFGVLLPHFVTTLPIKDGGATFSVCESEDDDSFNSVLFGALLELLKPIIYIYVCISCKRKDWFCKGKQHMRLKLKVVVD